MKDMHGIPAAPPDRDLPDHRRTREELLMKIDPENTSASARRKWGLPLAIATGVAAMSMAAVAVIGGQGGTAHSLDAPALAGDSPAKASTAPSQAASSAAAQPSTSASPSTAKSGTAKSGGHVVVGGAGSGPVHLPPASTAFTVTSTATTPIDSGAISGILASCLGADASQYHAVVSGRTPIASPDTDGVVVAVNSAGQYVQCETKGDKGTSSDHPATFINNRLWNPGHQIEFFDSVGEPAGAGKYLEYGAGHYTSEVARITVSYGKDAKQYPVTMKDGAFFYAVALSDDPTAKNFLSPDALLHVFNAAGQEIYSQ